MIKISKDNTGHSVSVRGTPAEIMLLYCVWETHLWPTWLAYDKLGDLKDPAAKQHRGVIKSINNGHDLLLANPDRKFQEALDFAIGRCRMLDIEVVND